MPSTCRTSTFRTRCPYVLQGGGKIRREGPENFFVPPPERILSPPWITQGGIFWLSPPWIAQAGDNPQGGDSPPPEIAQGGDSPLFPPPVSALVHIYIQENEHVNRVCILIVTTFEQPYSYAVISWWINCCIVWKVVEINSTMKYRWNVKLFRGNLNCSVEIQAALSFPMGKTQQLIPY